MIHFRHTLFFDLALILTTLFLFSVIAGTGCSRKQAQTGSPTAHETPEPNEPELAVQMEYIQRYTHKLGLSIDGENRELAEFYLHELNERVKTVIDEVPYYEGYQIAEFTKALLVPRLEPLDQQVEKENWAEAYKQFEEMIKTCNSCHKATNHGFIEVTPGTDKNYRF